MEPLKPAKTYQEQIEHLKNAHGLIVEDEAFAVDVLSRLNYYRISAYGLTFRDPANSERYLPGTRFEDLCRLYTFDRFLRSFLFPVLADIEIQFRSRIAYQLGNAYGPGGYLDSSHFRVIMNNHAQKTNYEKTMDDYQREKARQSSLAFVRHHNLKYGGILPVWAAVELFSFGMSSTLYKNMLRSDQAAVATAFGVDARHLQSWMLCFVEVRNICAHSGRLYNASLKQTPLLYSDQSQYLAPNKLFSVLLALKRILEYQHMWVSFSSSLATLADSFSDIDLSCMGFPSDWRYVLGV